MSYARTTDLLALLRDTGNGVRVERMPGLDWLVAGMAAANMFTLWISPTAGPITNQATTVWFKTATQSWAQEGSVWLWNGTAYAPATPYLWQQLFVAIINAGPP